MFPGSFNKKIHYSIDKYKYNITQEDVDGEKNEEYKKADDNIFNYVADNNDIPYYIEDSLFPKKQTQDKIICYNALEILNKDEIINDFCFLNGDSRENINIYICGFHMNVEYTSTPFLQYIGQNINNTIYFPKIICNNPSNILKESEKILDSFTSKKGDYLYRGYFHKNNNLYLFYEILCIDLTNHMFYYLLIDEIINHRKIANMRVSNQMFSFFMDHPEFIFVKDEENKPFEIPISAYKAVETKKKDFVYTFGNSKTIETEIEAIMGSYFYFTNYENAIKNKNNKYVIRYALFLGEMKVPMNYINDQFDSSLTTQELLKTNDSQYLRQLMRISDRDGKWSENYDSVYLGKIELDDGNIYSSFPTWVVKEYPQQLTLSIHEY